MADAHNHNEQLGVADPINDSVSAHSKPVAILFARELLTANRPRVSRQRSDAGHDSLTDFFGRRGLDEDPIACHAA
jgi:hypothetical protein